MLENISQREIVNNLKQLQILVRVNNLLLSRFILQLSETRKELGLPKRQSFFKFEILQDDVDELTKEFGKDEVIKALYRLDRLLLQNKQNCPNNIKKYIRNKLKKQSNGKKQTNSEQ